MNLCDTAPHNHGQAIATFTRNGDQRSERALCLMCLRQHVEVALTYQDDFEVRTLPHVPPKVYGRRRLAREGSVLR